MTKIPTPSYIQIINALIGDKILKITIPAHNPVKRSTLSHILKQANLDLDKFLELL